MTSGTLGQKQPAVSVIVPAYNAAWCVRDALDSLAAQTFSDFEVVVVNDGSTDDTESVVDDFLSTGRLRNARLLTQENRRLGGARNTGIRESGGGLVAFLDADDVWFPDRLGRVVETFGSIPAQFALVCHDEVATRDGARLYVNRYGPAAENMYEQLLFRGSCLSPSATTVRRSLLDRVGGFSEDPAFHSVEDYDLWLRLSLETRFFFLHEVLGEYRLHGASLSSRIDYNVRNELAVLDVHFTRRFDTQRRTPGRWLSMRKRKQLVHRRAARKHLQAGDRSAAVANLKRALRHYPLAPKAWALAGVLLAGGRSAAGRGLRFGPGGRVG